MESRERASRHRVASVVMAAACVLALTVPTPSARAHALDRQAPASALVRVADEWVWPLERFRLQRPFAAPAHPYGPGHRGLDLAPNGGSEVRAPAAGTIAFSGQVAGRGILTIDHGDGLVTTLEPLASDLAAGAAVARGAAVGTIATGGHTAPGALHFGVGLHGEYINPLLLVGEIPRAVLLPCC